MLAPMTKAGRRRGILPRERWPRSSAYSKAYFACVSSVAVVAVMPPRLNNHFYAVLMVLAFPLSIVALTTGFISTVLLFGPERNDALVHGWALLVWLGAISSQTVLLELVQRAWRNRAGR